MPRTKHLVIFFGVILVLLIVAFLYLSLRDARAVANLMMPQNALVIDAVADPGEPLVIVEEDTTRETTRRSLIAQLQNYRAEEEVEVVTAEEGISEELVLLSGEPIVDTEEPIKPKMCSEGMGSMNTVDSWGAINITRDGGARMITSLRQDESGLPLHTLVLADNPIVTGTELCLPSGMVGIALDGRVVEAESPFLTNVEGIAGYALDGFAIFGNYEEGAPVTSRALDACHGHIHAIVWNGVFTSMYHYHVTTDSPYALGCFRGNPAIVQ